jgi:uncharacterized protein (DUF4213/DUF364 family)
MTKQELFFFLKEKFAQVLRENQIEADTLDVTCRALSPEEAIGKTERRDFPILTGTDVMVQASFRGCCGQAFTEAPTAFSGSLEDVLRMDPAQNPHDRGIFIAAVNAVMRYLNRCRGTVHCRAEGPELCAADMEKYLRSHYPNARRIVLVGYQPALLEMLSKSGAHVRVLDLNPGNIGEIRYGITVEDGAAVKGKDIEREADLILCTGSSLCNGTIVDYMGLDTEVLFFGITVAGSADWLGIKRICLADQYE